MRRSIIGIAIIGYFIGCTVKQPNITITPLEKFSMVDTVNFKGKLIINKVSRFVISDWADKKQSLHQLDSFVNSSIDSSIYKYNQYNMIFYKESAKTNVKHLAENPRDLDRYSQTNDMIYDYVWVNGKLLSISEIKDGQIVNSKGQIEVSPPIDK